VCFPGIFAGNEEEPPESEWERKSDMAGKEQLIGELQGHVRGREGGRNSIKV
jgi:hypothetical protein